MNQVELRLLPHQFDLVTDDKTPIIGMCAGLGSGKTFSVTRKAILLMLRNAGCDGIMTEPNYPLLTQILIPEMREALDSFGVRYKFNRSEAIFYCNVDSKETRIICKSLENYDRLIGINAAWVIMDEFDTTKHEVAYNAYLKLLGRLRAGSVRQMVVVSTPEGFTAMHRIFVKEMDGNKRLIKAKTTDNHHLPDDYINLLRDSYPEAFLSAYLNGEFVNMTSGNVYSSFNRKYHHTDDMVQYGEPLHIGMDFNVNNMAAIVFNKAGDAVDELIEYADTPATIKAIQERYEGHNITIYPDASGQNTSSKNASISDIKLLRQAGFTVKVKRTNPRVRDRIVTVNKRFENGELLVNTKTCPELTECLEQQAYDKRGDPDKTSGFDHAVDAFGYPVVYRFPLKIEHKTEQRWHV